MSRARLDEIRREIDRLERVENDLQTLRRKGGRVPARLLQRPAASIGFNEPKGRTGEPVWRHWTRGWHISIPAHPKGIGEGLAKKINKSLMGFISFLKNDLEDERERILGQRNQIGVRKYD